MPAAPVAAAYSASAPMRRVIAAVSSPSRSRSRLSEVSRMSMHSAAGHSRAKASCTGAIATVTAWIRAMRMG